MFFLLSFIEATFKMVLIDIDVFYFFLNVRSYLYIANFLFSRRLQLIKRPFECFAELFHLTLRL
jgi:hypothetical protein